MKRSLQIIALWGALGATGACGVAEKFQAAQDKWDARAMEQRRDKCAAAHGTFADVDVSACIDGSAVVTARTDTQTQPCTGGEASHYEGQCLQRDAGGLFYFSDGPSVPAELLDFGADFGEGTDLYNWSDFLWQPAVNHDHCYHHGGPTYGYTQADCDGQMLDDLVALCSQQAPTALPAWFSKDRCTTNAQIMYASVRQFGAVNYARMATRVQYPPYAPMWRTLGLAAQPDDPGMRSTIDSVL